MRDIDPPRTIFTKQPRSIARPLKKTYHHIFTASCRRSSYTRTRTDTFQRLLRDRTLQHPTHQNTGNCQIRPLVHRHLCSPRHHTHCLLVDATGIEAAAAKLQHVWFHETNVTKFAYFTLPVQKNDTAGQCVSRGHPCLCRTGEPNPLCPYHAVQRHNKRLHYIFQHHQTEQLPFIPTDNGQFASKNDIMKIFSSAISLTDTPLTRPGPHGEPLPRFGEHVCRVSGAQFLSRLGYSLEAIQLIGRWGSDAVKRYIQEAPLAATPNHVLAPQSTARPDIQQIVRTELERLCNSWWILNQHSNTAHIPAVPETAQNTRWRTLCGWHYGSALYQKTFTRPTENFAANASRTSRKMTMAHPPKTN